jgi:DNA-binding HxlR family transcriptional regulator
MATCEIPEGGCPVELAISVFGSKWKLLILRVVILNSGSRYNELLKSIPGISSKELTRNLKELVGAGLICRSASESAYRLSADGTSLIPVFEAMRAWGDARLRSDRSYLEVR